MAHASKKKLKRRLRALKEAERRLDLRVKYAYTQRRVLPTQEKLLADVTNILNP